MTEARYNFLTVHRPEPQAMAAALAGVVGAAVQDVDVADEDAEYSEQLVRNRRATVVCGYRPCGGDLAMAWDVYVSPGAGPGPLTLSPPAALGPPDEAQAALRLAALLGTAVLCPAAGARPSAYWAAAPDGTMTRARVLEKDQDDGSLFITVALVEDRIEQLPEARVALIPEIFRDERIATPVTDAFVAVTDPQGLAPGWSRENRAREALLLWERLVRRAESGWAPAGRYPYELYEEDLRTRDAIEERLRAAAPCHWRATLARAVDELDARFRSSTDHDGGALFGPRAADGGWWWQRCPARLPWVY